MNAILFVIDLADETNERHKNARRTVVQNLQDIKTKDGEAELLATGCWLLHMPQGATQLGTIVAECDRARIPYRMMALHQKESAWVIRGSLPNQALP